MKKLAILTILISLLLGVFSTTAFAVLPIPDVDCDTTPNAQNCMTWFAVQDRKYESGDQYTRVMIEYRDSLPLYDITLVKLYDPDGTQITAVTAENAHLTEGYSAAGNFTWCDREPNPFIAWHWDWSNIVVNNWSYYYYYDWELHNYEYLHGDYTMFVTLSDGYVYKKSWFFDNYVNLPIVSLIKEGEKTKKKSLNDSTNKLNVEFLEDGSFVLRWYPVAMSSPINTRTHVIIYLTGTDPSDTHYREFYMIQPLELGMIVIPAEVLNILQCNEDYKGYLGFQVQTRTIDNNNRAYSNAERFYFDNTPECP